MIGKRFYLQTAGQESWLVLGGRRWRAAIGKGGLSAEKREGDGATPVGLWPFRELLFRPGRAAPPLCALPTRPIGENDGWCDAPDHPLYNRPVPLPFEASHEKLWRDDGLYDLIVPLGYNDDPPAAGLGSCIFMHIARPGYAPTEGCIALCEPDLRSVLALLSPGDAVEVLAPQG